MALACSYLLCDAPTAFGLWACDDDDDDDDDVANWGYTPSCSLIPASVGVRVFSQLARSREINLTVPSGLCRSLFMLAQCTHYPRQAQWVGQRP